MERLSRPSEELVVSGGEGAEGVRVEREPLVLNAGISGGTAYAGMEENV